MTDGTERTDGCRISENSQDELVPPLRNRLLHEVPVSELRAFRRVRLTRGRILHHALVPIDHLYFPETGLVLAAPKPDAQSSPVGAWMIGNEGFVGIPQILGSSASPHRRFVLCEGTALKIRTPDLLALLHASPKLTEVLLRYVHSALVETAQTAACNTRHSVTQRLSRTILTVADRLGLEDFAMTHMTLAQIIGVRRTSITDALQKLARQQAIRTGRDRITIIDRAFLHRSTCACYKVIARDEIGAYFQSSSEPVRSCLSTGAHELMPAPQPQEETPAADRAFGRIRQ